MENRSSRNRGLVSTSAAHQKASCGSPTAAGRALGTTEPGGPPEPSQVSAAGAFCGKTLLELGESSHIVLHGVTPVCLGRTGVKCIGSWRTKLYKHLLKIKGSVVSSMRGTLESCIREDRGVLPIRCSAFSGASARLSIRIWAE